MPGRRSEDAARNADKEIASSFLTRSPLRFDCHLTRQRLLAESLPQIYRGSLTVSRVSAKEVRPLENIVGPPTDGSALRWAEAAEKSVNRLISKEGPRLASFSAPPASF